MTLPSRSRSALVHATWALTALGSASCSSTVGGDSGGDGDGSGGDALTADGGSVGSGGDALGSGGDALGSGGSMATGGTIASGGEPPGSGGLASGGSTGGSGGDPSGSGGTGGDPSACTPDPDCEPTPPDTGDFSADCVARVNQFRACMCLPPLARNTEGEACASQQAQYDYENDSAHAGIRDEICSPQSLNNAAQNECPGYPSVASTIGLCHQQMFDEGQCDDFQTCGHYLNITDEGAESVSCGYYETPEGDVWMVQNFYF